MFLRSRKSDKKNMVSSLLNNIYAILYLSECHIALEKERIDHSIIPNDFRNCRSFATSGNPIFPEKNMRISNRLFLNHSFEQIHHFSFF